MNIISVLDYELYLRTIIITLFALGLFRISSSRLLGQYSPLDLIITIVVGAVLGTAIAGGLPLLSSLISATLVIAIHRGLVSLSFKYPVVEKFIKGDKTIVIRDGKFIMNNLEKSKLNSDDVLQALRSKKGKVDVKCVKCAYIEANGDLSFIMK